MAASRCLSVATSDRCRAISASVSCLLLSRALTISSPNWPLSLASSTWQYCICWSIARRKPMPNSAQSSNSEFDQAGPLPSGVCV